MKDIDIQMPYYRVVQEVWPMMKNDLVSVQQSGDWWDGIIQKYSDLSGKYDSTPAAAFARQMCLAAVNALEEIYRIQTGYMESVFGGENEQGGV